jgi:hypothetical protein
MVAAEGNDVSAYGTHSKNLHKTTLQWNGILASKISVLHDNEIILNRPSYAIHEATKATYDLVPRMIRKRAENVLLSSIGVDLLQTLCKLANHHQRKL